MQLNLLLENGQDPCNSPSQFTSSNLDKFLELLIDKLLYLLKLLFKTKNICIFIFNDSKLNYKPIQYSRHHSSLSVAWESYHIPFIEGQTTLLHLKLTCLPTNSISFPLQYMSIYLSQCDMLQFYFNSSNGTSDHLLLL